MEIEYKASVEKDLRRISQGDAARILGKIEQQLTRPDAQHEPLAGEFKGLFRLRVGDYRVIYSRTAERVLVLRVGHRKDIYRRDRSS